MKMKQLFLSAFILLSTMIATAESSIYIDDVRINPAELGGEYNCVVKMRNDGTCDRWVIDISYPCNLTPTRVTPLDGMMLSYSCDNGDEIRHNVPLCCSYDYSTITAFIGADLYWSQQTNTMCDGLFKWESGEHDLFELTIHIDNSLRNAQILFSGIMDCGHDGIDNEMFYSVVNFSVGYECGDVNGDGCKTLADATILIDYLLTNVALDEFQRDAADTNGDGDVTIGDVPTIIDMLIAAS